MIIITNLADTFYFVSDLFTYLYYLNISSFCGSGIQGCLASSSVSKVSYKAAVKVVARSGVTCEGLTMEGSASKFMWLAVFSFLLAGSWRQPSAPAMWPLRKAAHSRAACFLTKMTRKP